MASYCGGIIGNSVALRAGGCAEFSRHGDESGVVQSPASSTSWMKQSIRCSSMSHSVTSEFGQQDRREQLNVSHSGRSRVQTRAQTATCGRSCGQEESCSASSVRTFGMAEESTLYDVLGVSEHATVQEIKAAYRLLARKYHPDVVPEEERAECTDVFLRIHDAYSSLSDPQRKAAYDLQLSMQKFQARGYGYGAAPISSNWDQPSSMYCAPSSFSSFWKGRTWETDQCW